MYHSDRVNDAFKQNEIYQIGFRLAKKLGHETIYAADWNEELDESIDLALVEMWVFPLMPIRHSIG